MRFVGALPWLASPAEKLPEGHPSSVPVVAIVRRPSWLPTYRTDVTEIKFQWNKNEAARLLRLKFYKNVALGVVLDMLAPIFWRELAKYTHNASHRRPLAKYINQHLSQDLQNLEEVINFLREGQNLPNWESKWRPLGRLTGYFLGRWDDVSGPPSPTKEVLAWSTTLTDILVPTTYYTLRQNLEAAFISIAYYFYYEFIQAPTLTEYSPIRVQFPDGAEDPNLDPQYFANALNEVIRVWWAEFLDALAFMQAKDKDYLPFA